MNDESLLLADQLRPTPSLSSDSLFSTIGDWIQQKTYDYHRWPATTAGAVLAIEQHHIEQAMRGLVRDPESFRLVKDGRTVARAEYVKTSDGQGRLLDWRVIERHMDAGATCVLNGVDELWAPVGDAAKVLEQALDAVISVNAYYGKRNSRGFKRHWDDHHVLVCQVLGVKQWSVWPAALPHPAADDPAAKIAPDSPPQWTGLLTAGDILYLPKGWWHEAQGTDEHTCHVTFAITRAQGVDFLKWLVKQLAGDEFLRRDLVFPMNAEYRDELRSRLGTGINAATVQMFRDWLKTRRKYRDHAS